MLDMDHADAKKAYDIYECREPFEENHLQENGPQFQSKLIPLSRADNTVLAQPYNLTKCGIHQSGRKLCVGRNLKVLAASYRPSLSFNTRPLVFYARRWKRQTHIIVETS